MATITKKEYRELNAMLSAQEYCSATHTLGVTKGEFFLDIYDMPPDELVRTVQRAVPSLHLLVGLSIPPCPFGPHRLYNLAVDELVRRYRSYGREWMRTDAETAEPRREDV